MAGTKLRDLASKAGEEDDPEQWIKCHKDVINRCVDSCVVKLWLGVCITI